MDNFIKLILCICGVLGLFIFFIGWFSNISQVKENNFDQSSYGWASFRIFKQKFDETSWTHKKEWKYSLFYDTNELLIKHVSKIHADIFMFNGIGMIMKTPIDYYRAILYTHNYIKHNFKEDFKHDPKYKWE